jgi:hypothetical protein
MANIVGANVFSFSAKNVNTAVQQSCCGCYKENSTDTRCCGVCYCCCPAKHIDKTVDLKRCDCCPNDFCEYWYSGYVQTNSGYGPPQEEMNGICCWFCFPVKFPLFFPCFLGSLVNTAINRCCAAPTKRNYLF